MNTSNVVGANIATQSKKRFGLFPARIGSQLAHKIGVAMPIEPPRYSTATGAPGSLTQPLARTRLARAVPRYEFRVNDRGEKVAVAALPGATVYLEVQDVTRLEEEFLPLVKWQCRHPDCAGQSHASKDELVASHADNRDLVHEAERSPAGQAHMFYGVLEIAGAGEKKDEKTGKVTQPATPPTILVLSDEE